MLFFFGFQLYKNSFYFFVDNSDSEDDYYEYLNKSITSIYTGSTYVNGKIKVTNDTVSKQWDETHQKLHCCGLSSYKNFETSKTWRKKYLLNNNIINSNIPASCCHLKDQDKFPDDASEVVFTNGEECITKPNRKYAYLSGCWEELKNKASWPARMMIGFGVFCVVVILADIILIFLLLYFTNYDNTVDVTATKPQKPDNVYGEIFNETIYSVHRGQSNYYAHSDYSGHTYRPNKSENYYPQSQEQSFFD